MKLAGRPSAIVVAVAFSCFVASASCTALLGISDPVDDGLDAGARDSSSSDLDLSDRSPDISALDTRAIEGAADASLDVTDGPVEGAVDSASACSGSPDGTVCAPSPRAICLAGACKPSVCGDGFVDPGNREECDRPGAVDGAGCDHDCTFSCGSALVPAKGCNTSFCAHQTCSAAHACVADPAPCPAPSASCKSVQCDEATRTCPETLIDADGDGHGPASSPPVAPCDDCDDTDANALPGQTAYFSTPRRAGGYDYDCDGAERPENPSPGNCTSTGPATCYFLRGWQLPVPACGASGALITACPTPGCTPTLVTTTQACR